MFCEKFFYQIVYFEIGELDDFLFFKESSGTYSVSIWSLVAEIWCLKVPGCPKYLCITF